MDILRAKILLQKYCANFLSLENGAKNVEDIDSKHL